MEMEMLIPDDMIEACGKIFSGEYDIEYSNPTPTILDIGANVGAFSRWAKYKWPNSTIHAYEPLDQCYKYLLKNTASLQNVFCHQVAVGAKSETRTIYYGTGNRGQSSFNRTPQTRDYGVDINVIAANTLPYAHIVKVDTEGAELEILQNISFDPDIILIEYHSASDRITLEEMYSEKYYNFEHKFMNPWSGNLKFINTSIIKIV